jgi:SAM-dependent methyltransferase
VRTFLLPLVAAKHLRWPLQATLFVRDGYEPDEIYQALRPWQRLNPDLFDVVTLATLLERPGKAQNATAKTPSKARDPKLTAHILQRRIARLGKQIRRAANLRESSRWSEYTQQASHYQPTDTENKKRFVKETFERLRPQRVLDIGANTGTYSLLAAEAGARVVAIDSDSAALETLWRSAAQNNKSITVLVANIARPTPAAGWRNREHFSLLDRLTGQFDLVLMLAVVHHLILREQLPLAHIADLCATLTRRWLLLEWVPPSDPMYQEWLRGRDDLYGAGSSLLAGFAVFALVVTFQLGRASLWRPGPQSFAHPIAAPTPHRPRLVWILFDELAYKPVFEARDPSLQLPNLDRLRAETTLYSDVTPIAYRTTRAIPSLLLGRAVTDVTYTSNNRYLVQIDDGSDWKPFDPQATLFGMAAQHGLTTSIVGWYVAYCPIFQNLVHAAQLDGLLRHAEDHAGGFVLGDGRGAPACFISSMPRAPSSPIPVRITPTAFCPA